MQVVSVVASLALAIALANAYIISGESESLAVRMLQAGVQHYEASTDNIPEVAKKLNLTTLVDYIVKARLNEALEEEGPYTVFGPTNKAFTDLPDWVKKDLENPAKLHEFLTYHVLEKAYKSSDLKNDLQVGTLQGQKIRFNIYNNKTYTAQCKPIDLSKVDQAAANGLIHELTDVMIPPVGNAVRALYKSKIFETLLKALRVAELTETLTGPGPFTLFAPTDDAFNKLPAGELEKLLKNKGLLKEVLTYHLVKGTACSAGLKNGPVKTVNGQSVQINISKDGVKVNNATVTSADVSIDNGVLHAIDTVLFPKNSTSPYYF